MEQQNRYHVIVSERATQMLVSHAAFLAQVSPEAAERLTEEFEKTANSLETMPQRCPWLTGEYIPRNAYRFILFEKRYMIIFQIVDDIVYAVDCTRDYGLEVKINKEIRNYTESMFFGLSMRQFLFSVLACGVAVGLFFLLRGRFGTETLSWMCILGASPFAVMGFVRYNGMTAEQFV